MLIRTGSADNSRIKLVRRLATRKGRLSEGRFAAEGINLLREAVSCGLDIDFIVRADGYDGGDMEDYLLRAASSPDMTVVQVPQAMFDRLTDAEHGAGVITVIRTPSGDAAAEILRNDSGSNVLVLDRVQDPGNIGTMIRTAVAAGYSAVVAVKGTADIYSPKVLRATAGMVFRMSFAYAEDAEELAEMLRAGGRRIVVTDPAGGTPYYKEDLRSGVALVIGNEGSGISREIMDAADVRVTLPMKGEIESLNAAVSAAILMYEAVRA